MPRSRNIKPGFFVNDELAEIHPLGRLLFIGLWTIADREGRLRDQPKKIKIQVLPYDECDVDDLLNQLQDAGFILRYEADNFPCIQVLNFAKHQNPHMKEQASELPAPDLHHASTMQAPEEHGSCPADSLNLIPDSLNLIPDTRNKEKSQVCPYEKIKNLYNNSCPDLTQVRALSEKRKEHVRARWRQYKHDLNVFVELFKKTAASEFLNGKNDRSWSANFDWLMNEHNMAKVLEGKYDNKTRAPALYKLTSDDVERKRQEKLRELEDRLAK